MGAWITTPAHDHNYMYEGEDDDDDSALDYDDGGATDEDDVVSVGPGSDDDDDGSLDAVEPRAAFCMHRHVVSQTHSNTAGVPTESYVRDEVAPTSSSQLRKRERLLDHQAELCIQLADAVQKLKEQQTPSVPPPVQSSATEAEHNEEVRALRKALAEKTREATAQAEALKHLVSQLSTLETEVKTLAVSVSPEPARYAKRTRQLEDADATRDDTRHVAPEGGSWDANDDVSQQGCAHVVSHTVDVIGAIRAALDNVPTDLNGDLHLYVEQLTSAATALSEAFCLPEATTPLPTSKRARLLDDTTPSTAPCSMPSSLSEEDPAAAVGPAVILDTEE